MPASRQSPELPGSAAPSGLLRPVSLCYPAPASRQLPAGSPQQAALGVGTGASPGLSRPLPTGKPAGASLSILSPTIGPAAVQVKAWLVSPAFIAPHSAKTKPEASGHGDQHWAVVSPGH